MLKVSFKHRCLLISAVALICHFDIEHRSHSFGIGFGELVLENRKRALHHLGLAIASAGRINGRTRTQKSKRYSYFDLGSVFVVVLSFSCIGFCVSWLCLFFITNICFIVIFGGVIFMDVVTLALSTVLLDLLLRIFCVRII